MQVEFEHWLSYLSSISGVVGAVKMRPSPKPMQIAAELLERVHSMA